MPHPDILREYDAILPGSAERILQMAEVAAKGDHEINAKLADAEIDGARQGRGLAFFLAFLAFLAIVLASGFFAFGNNVAGVALVSMPVVLMVQAMFGGRDKG